MNYYVLMNIVKKIGFYGFLIILGWNFYEKVNLSQN